MWRPTTTGLPNAAGSRMLCPPRGTMVPPMNTTSARENRPLNSPIESRSRTPGNANEPSLKADRRTNDTPAASSLPAAASNSSGFRGASMSSNCGCAAANLRNASMTMSSSSGGMVLAATQTARGCKRSRKQVTAWGGSPGLKSNFRFPPTVTFSAGAPIARNLSLIAAFCARITSGQRRMWRKNQRHFRYRGAAWSEMRPFTAMSPQPARFTSRNRLGQISVSATTSTLGLSRRSTRRITNT